MNTWRQLNFLPYTKMLMKKDARLLITQYIPRPLGTEIVIQTNMSGIIQFIMEVICCCCGVVGVVDVVVSFCWT